MSDEDNMMCNLVGWDGEQAAKAILGSMLRESLSPRTAKLISDVVGATVAGVGLALPEAEAAERERAATKAVVVIGCLAQMAVNIIRSVEAQGIPVSIDLGSVYDD